MLRWHLFVYFSMIGQVESYSSLSSHALWISRIVLFQFLQFDSRKNYNIIQNIKL